MNRPQFSPFVYEDADQLARAVAQRITQLAAQAIAARGVFNLALAGGETPRRCYEQLRYMVIDWAHVHIYFGDERCLPVGDSQRNDRMARDCLLDYISLPPSHIHSIPTQLGAQQAATRYLLVLADDVTLDLVLLGLGEDGHTASLFPANPATESENAVVPVFNAPKPPSDRVSLSMTTLNAARNKLFLVAGVSKRYALEQMLRGIKLPAAKIKNAEWYVERTALPITT
ncbi:MAG: 6-phosphogluconolactonase [Gallionella sp.]